MTNPWLNIWIRPRETIREIIDTDMYLYVTPLAMIAGILGVLDRAMNRNAADDIGLTAVLIAAPIIGPVSGLLSIYFGGWLLRWSGSLLGGKATSDEVRAALAWSSYVRSIGIIVYLIFMMLFAGREAFFSEKPILYAKMESNILLMLLFGSLFIGTIITLGIWYIIVCLKCLAEAHQFSVWKALLATIIFAIVIIIPILIIVLFIHYNQNSFL